MIPTIDYARRSSEKDDDQVTLKTQMAACLDYDARHGLQSVAKIQDEFTGTVHIKNRKHGSEVWQMLASGEAKAVTVYTLDRLSRADLVDTLAMMRDLMNLGAQIHVCDVGVITDLMDIGLIVRAWQGGDERRKVVERLSRGKRGRAQIGKPVWEGRIPDGYRRAINGNEKMLVVVKKRASIIREIFALRIGKRGQRMSINQIVNRLNRKGVPAPSSGRWNPSTIRRILYNEIYIGKVTRYGFTTTLPQLRIVDPADFDQVQMLRRSEYAATFTRKNVYLLSGYFWCGICGRHMYGNPVKRYDGVYVYYECTSRSRPVTLDRHKRTSFIVHNADALVWSYLCKVIEEWDVLRNQIEARPSLRAKTGEQPAREQLADIEHQIATHEDKLNRMVRSLADASARVLAAREKTIREIDAHLTDLHKRREKLITEIEGDAITRQRRQEAISRMDEFKMLVKHATFDQRRQVLHALDVHVTAYVGTSGKRYLRIGTLISSEQDIEYIPYQHKPNKSSA